MTDHQAYLLVAVGAYIVLLAVIVRSVHRHKVRTALGALDPEVDAEARREARGAIDRAGAADTLIDETLRHAYEQIEAGRSAGAEGSVYLALARRAYARTGDDEVDAMVALSLLRACEVSAVDGARANQEFNDWLRRNGSKLS